VDILLVEDNKSISQFLIKGFKEKGFATTLAINGMTARTLMDQKQWKIIILDIMLPDIDGYELLQYARKKKIQTPIIILSALDSPDDKINALNMGADDYLSKPFHFNELIARINAITRRKVHANNQTSLQLECFDLKLSIDTQCAQRANKNIPLTMQEFKLLKLLMENANKPIPRVEILQKVWGLHFDPNTNIVDVYISYLRNKIEIDKSVKLITTVHGIGYMIKG